MHALCMVTLHIKIGEIVMGQNSRKAVILLTTRDRDGAIGIGSSAGIVNFNSGCGQYKC